MVLTIVMELEYAMTGLGSSILYTGKAAWGEGDGVPSEEKALLRETKYAFPVQKKVKVFSFEI